MNANISNSKKVAVFLAAMFFSASAFSQAFSSGGGSSTGYKSTLGYQNTANGNYSLAAGWGNQASGQTSFALGYHNQSIGLNSMAIGMHTKSQNNYGITIGKGYSSSKPLINTTTGIMLGSGSNLPTLFISPNNTENQTGKVGIGNVTSPQAKLHIAGDGYEDASILLAAASTRQAVLQFRSSSNSITVGSDNVMKFNAPNMHFYPTGQVLVNGAFKATGNITLSSLAGSSTKVLTIGTNGQLSSTEFSALGDNLGNHIATQNINLNGKKIVNGTSGTGGIFVSTGGMVRIGTGTSAPTNALEVNGTIVSTNLKVSGLAATTPKVLTVGAGGQVSSADYSALADNMGNHTASQNINLNGKKIVGSTSSAAGIFVSSDGFVGINNASPLQKLHVLDGNILISRSTPRELGSTNGCLYFGDVVSTNEPYGKWGIEYVSSDEEGHGLNFWKPYFTGQPLQNGCLFLDDSGKVGIGTTNPTEKLTVNGKVLAREVIVSNDIRTWPDFVFAPDHEMMSLQELEAFVNEHNHLPGVPTAEEVGKNGINLGEMNAILLQKIEEMTLQMIEMEKRIHDLESQSVENE